MDDRRAVIDVTLAPGRDRSVRRRQPWLRSEPVAEVCDGGGFVHPEGPLGSVAASSGDSA